MVTKCAFTTWADQMESLLYIMAIGLAESEDDGLTFSRLSPAPVLSRSAEDPWMVSTLFVFKKARKIGKCGTSGIGWVSKSPPKSKYQVKRAESSDGVAWTGSGVVSIPIEGKETNLASPWFWREGQNWHGLYCSGTDQSALSLRSEIKRWNFLAKTWDAQRS